LEITSVSVQKVNDGNRLRGYASVKIDDCFAIKGMRIIDGNNGLHIAMPNRRKSDGKFVDIVNPTTQECRDKFTKAILDEYNKILDEE